MGRYTFPVNLRRIRKERGMSQVMLAEKSGISQVSISYYENCLEYPSIDKVYDLARALGVNIEELISTSE